MKVAYYLTYGDIELFIIILGNHGSHRVFIMLHRYLLGFKISVLAPEGKAVTPRRQKPGVWDVMLALV